MKKIIILSTAILALSSGYVMAEDGGPQGGPQGDGPKKGKMMQQKLDTNGDGVVSKSEFLAHAEERFSKIDKDGSGDISKEEGRAAHKHMRERKKEMMVKMKERRENRQSETSAE